MGISFLSSICPCMICLLKEKYAKKNKSKKIKMLYIWLQVCLLGDVEVIGCTSKVIVSIKQLWLCVSYSDFLISQIVIICRHLCNLTKCFTHNTQYSLLLLIHVQVQCDLVITRNTCVNVCSLNYLNLFLKYKIGKTCCVCVCVCFGSMCLKLLLRDDFESLKYWLDPWLCC